MKFAEDVIRLTVESNDIHFAVQSPHSGDHISHWLPLFKQTLNALGFDYITQVEAHAVPGDGPEMSYNSDQMEFDWDRTE